MNKKPIFTMKKDKKTAALVCGLLLAVMVIPPLHSQEEETDAIFSTFLYHLVKRHGHLKNIAMPDVEIRTAPGYDDEAVYLLVFKTTEDVEIFTAALKEENVPYLTFPKNELQVGLFYSDMVKFIWTDVLGF